MQSVLTAEVLDDGDMPAAMWRDGRLLVMRKDVTLPDICVKSNEPCQGRRLKRTMYWHHPAIFLTVLLGLLIYVVCALVLRKSATVWIPLTDQWWGRRRRAIAIAWGVVAAGVLCLILSIFLLDATNGYSGWGILLRLCIVLDAI